MLQPADHEEDLVTFDEFCRVVQDGQKAEWLFAQPLPNDFQTLQAILQSNI